jgi:SOS-response transcriptional repressor LexA
VSYGEIQKFLGLASKSGISTILAALQEQDYLTFVPARSRSIVVTRRIKPLFEYFMFDDETKSLRPLSEGRGGAC